MAELDLAIDPAEVVDLARRAITVRTVNPPGDEAVLASLFADYLRDAGVGAEILEHGAGRASLSARIQGRGAAPGLILTGHLDVVGAGEAPWQHEPFAGEVAGGRLYGRGASDMKGALAAMAVAAAAIRRASVPLVGDLILAFTAGEEIDSLGAIELARAGRLDGAGGMVVGEPSALGVYVAEKGNLTVGLSTFGRTAHASMPELGNNAVYAMAELVGEIERWRFSEPPHPLLGAPTVGVGTIHGGVAPNVVPDRCAIEVDFRTLPGQTHSSILDWLESLLVQLREGRGVDARVTRTLGREAVETSQDDPLVIQTIASIARVTGSRPAPTGVMYATDAAVLVPALGVPMVICGPGEREQAHQTDEYVETAALVDAARIYADLARNWLS